MKKLLQLVLLALGLGSTLNAQVGTTLTNGLVAQWLLNGNANDSLGVSPGVATNVQWISTNGPSGEIETIGFFNGNSSIKVSPNPALNLNSNGFTLSVLVNPSTFQPLQGSGNNFYQIIYGGGITYVQNSSYNMDISGQTH
jgi:hypothetical protein